jgi:DNA-binding response OmpR family regulator
MPETPAFVLNVDNDPIGRYFVTQVLREAGFPVREASSGREALALAQQQPALIILVANLPDIHGLEVCRRLKAEPATAAVPVLHLTVGFPAQDGRTDDLQGMADGHLSRYAGPVRLVAYVKALLRVSRAPHEAVASLPARQGNPIPSDTPG